MTPSPPSGTVFEMACDKDDREGKSPSPVEPQLGRNVPQARRPVVATDDSRPSDADSSSNPARSLGADVQRFSEPKLGLGERDIAHRTPTRDAPIR